MEILKILIKIRAPGSKSAHFLRPPARPWLPTVARLASRPQRPQDAHAPGAALQAGNARPWPMAGYIHPRHHCAVASLVHRLFSSSVDALESQVQFCWQDAHGERHEACTRVCEEEFSVFDQNFVQNKGPPKRNLGFKIRGQTEKNLGIAQLPPSSKRSSNSRRADRSSDKACQKPAS